VCKLLNGGWEQKAVVDSEKMVIWVTWIAQKNSGARGEGACYMGVMTSGALSQHAAQVPADTHELSLQFLCKLSPSLLPV